jgi:hypothetical protein
MRKCCHLLVATMLGVFGAATPAHAAWYEAKSKHFLIYANESPNDLRDYAGRLEKFDQAVRLVRGMADPDLTDSGRVTIFVLRDIDAIQSLIGRSGVAGYYEFRSDGAFAFVPRTTSEFSSSASGQIRQKDPFMRSEEIFFHEYAHHLQLQNARVAIPMWAAEGFAEFFATADLKRDGSVVIGKFPDYRWYGVHNRDAMPIDQLVGQTYPERLTQEQMDALYARGWLLTDYLAMDDSRKGQFSRYISAIQSGTAPLDAAKAAFGDLGKLQHDMDSYSGHLTEITIQPQVLHVGGIALRPLRPGEAAMMDVHIHSKNGVNSSTAPALAAQAAKIAASYPDDTAAQADLAEAEFDAKDYKAADAAADRALAANPNNLHALIYKGRAQIALAREHPKTADWESAQHWFVKANQVDTESAEALYQFYLSFGAAGQPVNSNAMDALLYAADLAPLDIGVRLTAVGALLGSNRIADARSLLQPMVNLPHISEGMRDLAQKVLDAMATGDARKASAALSGSDQKPAAKTASK